MNPLVPEIFSNAQTENELLSTFTVHEIAHHLLNNFCQQFSLDANIEFSIYEQFDYFYKKYCDDIVNNDCLTSFRSNGKLYKLKCIENDLLINLLAIISLCTKYFETINFKDMFKLYPEICAQNEERFSLDQFFQTEFKVFRYLDFQVNFVKSIIRFFVE